MKKDLEGVYKQLYACFGPQRWWPGESPFEVMVGAILTQNTNWTNVEKAINNLKKNNLLTPKKIYLLPEKKLAAFIVPAGYYNIKAKRLKAFINFFYKDYNGSVKKMARYDTQRLRRDLLSVNGIGPETADSILLYALNKPVFVIDAYTKRIFSRHGFIDEDTDYHKAQDLFMQNMKNDIQLFNEYHALIVRLGKDFCLKKKPRCAICPLK